MKVYDVVLPEHLSETSSSRRFPCKSGAAYEQVRELNANTTHMTF